MYNVLPVILIVLPLLDDPCADQSVLTMTMKDRLVVGDTEKWTVKVERYLMLRFANVSVAPKNGDSFSLMLYFKCDTPNLAQFDSLDKMERAVRLSSAGYLRNAVEKTVNLKRLDVKGWYGCYTVLTDARLVGKGEIPAGEFKYLVRGMVRLSPDSALGFSLMTNAIEGPEYEELFEYILHFVRPKKIAAPD